MYLKVSNEIKIVICLVIIAILITLIIQLPFLIDRYSIPTDFRVVIWWMSKFKDNDLFKNDYLANLMISKNMRNYGFVFLFKMASFFISPVNFGKILPFFIVPIATIFLFKIGKVLKNTNTGIYLALFSLFVFASCYLDIFHGLQRSFGVLFIIISFYYFIIKKYNFVLIFLILECLFYPPAMLVTALNWLLSIISKSLNKNKLVVFDKEMMSFLIGVSISFLILLPTAKYAVNIDTKNIQTDSYHADIVEYNENIRDNPRFNRGGELPFFHFDYKIFNVLPLYFLFGPAGVITDPFKHLIPFIYFGLFAIIILLFVKKPFKELNKDIWIFFLTGIILFVIAWSSAFIFSKFIFYNPSRYIRFTLFLTLCAFIATNFNNLIELISTLSKKIVIYLFILSVLSIFCGLVFSPTFVANHFSPDGILEKYNIAFINKFRSAAFSSSITLFIIVCLNYFKIGKKRNWDKVILLSLLIPTISLFHFGPGNITIKDNDKKICSFLSKLDKNILVAGHPWDMSNLPILCNKSVLINSHMTQEFEDPISRKIVYDFFSAYYTDSLPILLEFMNKYKIDIFIVNDNHFKPNYTKSNRFYYEPYNSSIIKYINGKKEFIWDKIPKKMKIKITSFQYVVRNKDINKLNKNNIN